MTIIVLISRRIEVLAKTLSKNGRDKALKKMLTKEQVLYDKEILPAVLEEYCHDGLNR
jgi:hypothetical protein